MREQRALLAQRAEQPVDVVLDVVEVECDAEVGVPLRADDLLRRELVDERLTSVERTETSGPRRTGSRGVGTIAPSSSSPSISRAARPAMCSSIAAVPASSMIDMPATPA